jgi:hypothetical protein
MAKTKAKKVQEEKATAEPYYTNSTQLPVGYTDDLFEAVKLQDSLQTKYTGGTVRRFGRPGEPYLRAEALLAHLAKERSADAVRLRAWVEREIAFPARRERERLGIRAAALSDLPSPD